MIRLFLSLYLVIILGILLINLTAEQVWQNIQQESNHELANSKLMVQRVIVPLIDSQAGTIDEQLQSISVKSPQDFVWLPEQQKQLDNGEVVVNFDSSGSVLFYYYHARLNKIFEIGPFEQASPSAGKVWLLKLLSYGLLAIVIALWTRPVWRDLNQLTTISQRIDNNDFSLQPVTNHHSPIYPIVRTVNKMANRISQLLSEQKYLVNAVSHELRTPLSRLRFSLALLTNIEKEQLEDIENDVEEIEHLVQEMLDYARLEHVAAQQAFAEINIVQLLEQQGLKHARSSNIKIDISTSQQSIFWVCNAQLVERACQNLITNALRYANSIVKVSVIEEHGDLTITVEDDGVGIDPKEWPHVFAPFSRVDKSRNKQQGGYGLGLAIVKKSSLWHDGDCEVGRSNLGGAKFTMRLSDKKGNF